MSRLWDIVPSQNCLSEKDLDLIQAALIDLETGTSNRGRASQHLNGVGKILQIKKMKDSAIDSVKKIGKDAGKLPGTGRKFA